MKLTYDEYKTFGGKLGENAFLSNIRKAIAYVGKLARIYTVSYTDENLKFALADLTDTFNAEGEKELEIESFSAGSYSEKKAQVDINYESKRYQIANTYLEISRVVKW